MKLTTYYLTNNDCYKAAHPLTPKDREALQPQIYSNHRWYQQNVERLRNEALFPL